MKSGRSYYGGQFKLSPELIMINYLVILFHGHSAAVSRNFSLYLITTTICCLPAFSPTRKEETLEQASLPSQTEHL